MNFIKNFVKALYEKHKNRKESTMIALFVYAIFGTFIYSVFYFSIKVYSLSAVILFTNIFFIAILHVFWRGHIKSAVILTFINANIIVFSSIYIIGPNSGIQYFLLSAIVFLFVSDALKKALRYSLSLACLVEYILIEILFSDYTPLVYVSQNMMLMIHIITIIAAFGVVVYT